MVDRFERFSLAVFEISKHWHKLTSEELEVYGLKGPHSMYLIAMHQRPEGVTASQLCELCGRDKADVSRMMSIMEKKGLVIRENANQTQYKGLFKLTKDGKVAAEHACARAQLAVELASEGIDAPSMKIFYESLSKIAANLRRISKEGLPPTSDSEEV